ncbi:hypothetical protein J1614_000338 [Plenodomus biglobosus]|nr:hypothetical protein J1614_000338 [Plenodomus biglobosus]
MKVIARLPYPSTVPCKYGIASEVATMDFLQRHGVPIPKVFDWNSSTSNQVGSEYIIMEKVAGKELEDIWYTMTLQERMDMVEKIVDMKKILFAIQFPASGSLYYKDSLGADIPRVDFYGYQEVDPQLQIDTSQDYLKIAPHIVPERRELNHPTIRHPDLSPTNIFISDSGAITGIIDWQHTTILPIFLQAKIPKHFQNYGDDASETFQPPQLPEDFATLTESEKERETELYRRRQLHYFYLDFTNRTNKPHFRAMGTHDLVVRNRLYDTAGRPWEGDNTSLKAELIQASAYWPDIATLAMKQAEFPVKYSESEVTECLAIDEKQKQADGQMQRMRDFIGVNIDGWLPMHVYEEAREKERYIKEQMMDAADMEEKRRELQELWPFQDHEEVN